MKLKAHAKINWSLDITGVRPDGYHLMDMLMQPITLADTVTLENADTLSLSLSGTPFLAPDEKNLAYRAALALKQATGYPGGARVCLEKHIPVGAGLGGGSADAAAVLRGLNQLWQTSLTDADLTTLGLSLGADVPFCLHGHLTRTRGIGEILNPLPCGRYFPLIVVQPCRGLSTKEIFSSYSDPGTHPDIPALADALAFGNLHGAKPGNVLQSVSVRKRPEIGRAIAKLRDSGADPALMTGSGSAVFGVFPSFKKARAAFPQIASIWPKSFLTSTCEESIERVDPV